MTDPSVRITVFGATGRIGGHVLKEAAVRHRDRAGLDHRSSQVTIRPPTRAWRAVLLSRSTSSPLADGRRQDFLSTAPPTAA